MSTYKRFYTKGGIYFFTLTTYGRHKLLCSEQTIGFLRDGFRHVMSRRPFEIEAIAILPDHLHCMWQLPPEDADFSTRWMLIKKFVSAKIDVETNHRGEKRLWQRRFWEHCIRDDEDQQRHMDYIHYNPVKHGYVAQPGTWIHSSFKQAVAKGLYDEQWGSFEPASISGLDYE